MEIVRRLKRLNDKTYYYIFGLLALSFLIVYVDTMHTSNIRILEKRVDTLEAENTFLSENILIIREQSNSVSEDVMDIHTWKGNAENQMRINYQTSLDIKQMSDLRFSMVDRYISAMNTELINIMEKMEE